MRKVTFLLLAFSLSAIATAQRTKRIEIEFIGRQDKHADFTTSYATPTGSTSNLELHGKSHSVNLNYLQSVSKNLNVKLGAGYYRLGVDKIERKGRYDGDSRFINYDYILPIYILIFPTTNNYHYNNISFSSGISYEKSLSKNIKLTIGGDFTYLHTISQSYNVHVIKGYDAVHKTSDSRMLGFGINSNAGVLYNPGKSKFYLHPKLVIPIYQQINPNKIFGEDATARKGFNGAGLSVSVGRYFR